MGWVLIIGDVQEAMGRILFGRTDRVQSMASRTGRAYPSRIDSPSTIVTSVPGRTVRVRDQQIWQSCGSVALVMLT